ncbi:MAG: hypothetical protein HOL04_11110 [Gammaproteobacteria bacterium]|jgi:hypothetical protein|nr:hypothetical protein [Gammaproteobacteria bacterium]MBT4607728.1 hypothetical protein [Thiotrichales bacterium]MBT3472910.1 hypothetical protein [Gammaproteobacteria bacterium]MBT3966572.1 hypothetical protein [Gammaproteobacteria bacterium]MBT4081730.1 hypothetical protein [Gammaproteobacteria bacterium]
MNHKNCSMAALVLLFSAQEVLSQPLLDPTRPLNIQQQKEVHFAVSEEYTLGYILTGAREPVAMINGKRYSVGDKIGESMSVMEIAPGWVVLGNRDRQIKVSLFPSIGVKSGWRQP